MNDFTRIANKIESFLDKKTGLNHDELKFKVTDQMFGPIARGIINGLTIESFEEFLDDVAEHKIDPRKLISKKGILLHEIVAPHIYNNPWFAVLVEPFYNLKPGNSQAGPLEFLLCFLSKDSIYVQGAQSGCDVIIGGMKIEIKSHGSQKTATPAKCDFYKESDDCDVLLVVKPATKNYPVLITAVDFNLGHCWSEIIKFKGDQLYMLAAENNGHHKLTYGLI